VKGGEGTSHKNGERHRVRITRLAPQRTFVNDLRSRDSESRWRTDSRLGRLRRVVVRDISAGESFVNTLVGLVRKGSPFHVLPAMTTEQSMLLSPSEEATLGGTECPSLQGNRGDVRQEVVA
jgi:hypothetical protein